MVVVIEVAVVVVAVAVACQHVMMAVDMIQRHTPGYRACWMF